MSLFYLARGVGHTSAIIDGAKKANAIVVCATSRHAQQIKQEHGVEAISIDNLERLQGRKNPVVFDHFAVVCLLEALESSNKALAEENKRYREALEWIANQENLFFSECSQAEEIIERCKSALGQEEKK